MTQVAEAPVSPPRFVMPPIGVGQRVLIYHQGTKESGKLPSMGHVRKVYGDKALVQSYDNQFYNTVPHIDDPRLVNNPDLRQEGAWDYTSDDLAVKKFMEDTRDKLAALERQVAGLIAKKG